MLVATTSHLMQLLSDRLNQYLSNYLIHSFKENESNTKLENRGRANKLTIYNLSLVKTPDGCLYHYHSLIDNSVVQV
jgi:hypothetical protein